MVFMVSVATVKTKESLTIRAHEKLPAGVSIQIRVADYPGYLKRLLPGDENR